MKQSRGYQIRTTNLDLLLDCREFKEAVNDFRKEWHISKSGLSDEKAGEWLWHLAEKSDQALARTPHIKNSDILINAFQAGIKALARKFKIPSSSSYTQALKGYLLTGRFDQIPHSNIRAFWEIDKNTKKKRIFLEVYSDTTLDDIRNVWDVVKKLQKHTEGYIPGRKRTLSNPKLTKRIQELKNMGLTGVLIAKQIKDEFPGCSINTYSDVNRILHRIKQKTVPFKDALK